MQYRLATEDDASALAEMRWDFRTETVERPPSIAREEFVAACAAFFRHALDENHWVCWLAEQDGQIASHIFIQRIRKIPNPFRLHGEFGYISNAYTRSAFRNQGIGAALLERVKDWAKQQDLEFLILWPSDTSIAFYERAGFSPEHEILQCRLRGDAQ
jgi:GNAT superfamily N-acetyltransferase